MVFVDFAKKAENQRPDFYVLTYKEWLQLLKNKQKNYHKKHPDRRVDIRSGCLYFHDEVNKSGKHYVGCGVSPTDLTNHLEKWEKIQVIVKGTFKQFSPTDG